jgi:Xaa-Pro aminopeptidase
MRGYLNSQTINKRITALQQKLLTAGRNYDTALIIDRVNQYYFTGTMQDGILVLRRDGYVGFFVRKSSQRASLESPLENIIPIRSYGDMLEYLPSDLGDVYLETGKMPLLMLQRLRKTFLMKEIMPLENIIMTLRMVKSEQELSLIRESGRLHNILLREKVPALLRENMSETDLMAEIYAEMIRLGHHGVSRFGMFQLEMVAGQLGFGENSLYPTCFDGPGGMLGMSPAVPAIGSRERKLKKGDLVFVDIGFGVDGYHSDKTQVYSFGAVPSDRVTGVHQACLDVIRKSAELLLPGTSPAYIYETVINSLPAALGGSFMGYGDEQVRFLGHGVGLQVDEPPVLASGFEMPLQENMVIAIEPKSGIAGAGMVGAEETFIIRPGGAQCVTGGASEIIVI